MSQTDTIERTTSQALSMALAVLDLSPCEADLLTRAATNGSASITPRHHEQWSQGELSDAANGLADRSLVTHQSDDGCVAVADDLTSAVVEAGEVHESEVEKTLTAQRSSLYSSIVSRVRKTPRILGLHRDVNEDFVDVLRRHTVMVGATPMFPLAPPATRQVRRDAALAASRRHGDSTVHIDVVSPRLLSDPIEARYFAAVDRQPDSSVKILPGIALRMAVLDGRAAIIPVDPRNLACGALLIDDEDAVAHVGLQLAMQVAKARAFTVADSLDLSERELSVLKLLGKGLTDAAVGRRLWLCDRSVRRLIVTLQQKLNVESRFELAVEAARRGLL